ncbi:MAG TPA: hypothetical protein VG123_31555, partial [Streptosporangiaceae bacterium]|nr:hypothetical protein [Streptosporangiaceae bacterium]
EAAADVDRLLDAVVAELSTGLDLRHPHPPAPAAFALLYGMLTDRFGVTWIVGVESPRSS